MNLGFSDESFYSLPDLGSTGKKVVIGVEILANCLKGVRKVRSKGK